MRFLAGLFGLGIVLAGCSPAPEPKPEPKPAAPPESLASLLRYHFSGGATVLADTNATTLSNLWTMAATREFAGATLDKLARAPREFWRTNLPATAPDHAADVRVLLDDLLQSESGGEWQAGTKGPGEFLLAVKLPEERAVFWSATLARIAADWTGYRTNALTTPGLAGWQLKKTDPPNLIQLARVGGWVVMGLGQGKNALFAAAVERASKQSSPVEAGGAGWLSVFADLPKLAARFGWDSPVRLGELQFTALGRDENVRVEGTVHYSSPLDARLSGWQLPGSYITDPLTGFTVLRGLDGLLTRKEWAREWGLPAFPDQVAFWALANVPFQIFWSTPMSNTPAVLAGLEPRLNQMASNSFPPGVGGTFIYESTNATLNWKVVPPFAAPFLTQIQDGGQEFLHGGFFLRPPITNPPPMELFAAFLAKTNTLYYDWEITQHRLASLVHLTGFGSLLTGRPQSRTNDPGWLWLPQAAPLLGNTITEVTLNSPTELGFTRRGHAGLTGAELILLVRMFDSKDFPLHPWNWLKPDPSAFQPKMIPPPPQPRPDGAGGK